MNLFSEWKRTAHAPCRDLPVPPVPLVPESAILGQKRGSAEIDPFPPVAETDPTVRHFEPKLECSATCKRCGQPIAWGEVSEILDGRSPKGRRPGHGDQRWIALDADYHPHGCRRAQSTDDTNPAQQAAALLATVDDPIRRADLREDFEHRAGTCEFHGELSRDEAERVAFVELQRRWGPRS